MSYSIVHQNLWARVSFKKISKGVTVKSFSPTSLPWPPISFSRSTQCYRFPRQSYFTARKMRYREVQSPDPNLNITNWIPTSDSQIKVFTYLVHCCYLQLFQEERRREEGKKSGRMPAARWEHLWQRWHLIGCGEQPKHMLFIPPGGLQTRKHGGLQTSLSWHPGTTTKELCDLTKVIVYLYPTIPKSVKWQQ